MPKIALLSLVPRKGLLGKGPRVPDIKFKARAGLFENQQRKRQPCQADPDTRLIVHRANDPRRAIKNAVLPDHASKALRRRTDRFFR